MSGKDNVKNMFNNYFKAYKNSAKYKDDARFEIALRKSEFEETLDSMWDIYRRGNSAQIIEYQKQLDSIKSTGCKVYRNSQGKHKIVIGGNQ